MLVWVFSFFIVDCFCLLIVFLFFFKILVILLLEKFLLNNFNMIFLLGVKYCCFDDGKFRIFVDLCLDKLFLSL